MRMREISASEYPEEFQVFWLPTAVVHHYDDPADGLGTGDDGWSVEELVTDIGEKGEIEFTLQVGKSKHDVETRNDHRVCAFNGNHRLAAAKIVKLPYVPCENSSTFDSIPLTIAEIEALGGKLDAGDYKPPR